MVGLISLLILGNGVGVHSSEFGNSHNPAIDIPRLVQPPHIDNTTQDSDEASSSLVWLYGIAAATFLNLASISGVLFSPIIKKPYFPRTLLAMMGLGLGSMVSVSVLNILPTAFHVTRPQNICETIVVDSKPIEQCQEVHVAGIDLQFPAVVLVSIFVFFLVDQITKFWNLDDNQGDSSVASIIRGGTVDSNENIDRDQSKIPQSHGGHIRSLSDIPSSLNEISGSNSTTQIIKPITSIRQVPAIVYLILVSDGLHNFVDGLTIGAAFAAKPSSALAIVLAIFFEEVPCELGDFAVFLKAGLRIKHALILNVLGACTNYVGVIIGIAAGDNERVHQWIYSIAGGMFLYISLSIILVECCDIQTKITHAETSALPQAQRKRQLKKSLLKSVVVQNAGIIIGFALQFTIVYVAQIMDI